MTDIRKSDDKNPPLFSDFEGFYDFVNYIADIIRSGKMPTVKDLSKFSAISSQLKSEEAGPNQQFHAAHPLWWKHVYPYHQELQNLDEIIHAELDISSQPAGENFHLEQQHEVHVARRNPRARTRRTTPIHITRRSRRLAGKEPNSR